MISLELTSPKSLFWRPKCTMLESIGGISVNGTPKPPVLASASANSVLLFMGGRESWFLYVLLI